MEERIEPEEHNISDERVVHEKHILPRRRVAMQDGCFIPDECKLDLWAKVIVAKNIQTSEPILGSYDEYGEPVPAELVVTDLASDEAVECIYDFKITFDQGSVVENFVCSSKVVLTISFVAYFWIKTNLGYKTLTYPFEFTKTIPVNEFIKLDGTPLTSEEFKEQVDQSKCVVTNYSVAYINILPKVSTEQVIEIIITATVVDKLGLFRDVIVYGYLEEF